MFQIFPVDPEATTSIKVVRRLIQFLSNPVNHIQIIAVIKQALSSLAFMSVQTHAQTRTS